MDSKGRLIQELREENEDLRLKLKVFEAEMDQLRRQLGLDSSNSSKPPSSDGLKKPPARKRTQSSRKKGAKPSGGQKGHKGATLKQVEKPDKVVNYSLQQCPNCSGNLEATTVESTQKRQVFDILEPKVFVTEHQAEVKQCPCCLARVAAMFPDSVNAPVQYGSGVQALAIYFIHQQLIPEDRLKVLFEDLYNFSISTASLVKMGYEFSSMVRPGQESVLERLKDAPVKHLDETGFRIGGKTNWLHVICTGSATHYRISPKRKDLLKNVKGIAVHDHWKPYFSMKATKHALCNAHHLRELRAVSGIDKEFWAWTMSYLLRIIGRLSKESVKTAPIERIEKIYDQIVARGLKYHEQQPPLKKKGSRGPPKRRDGHNLLIRLRDFKSETLRCLKTCEVPFTNNQAEQDIRMMKVKQKISGGFRTEWGAQVFCDIRGFLSICRKQGLNLFKSITQVLSGMPPQFSFS